MVNKIKNTITSKYFIIGTVTYLYFFLLLLGILVPALRIGTSLEVGVAFIYRAVVFTVFIGIATFIGIKYRPHINIKFSICLLIFFVTNILAIFLPYGNIDISYTARWVSTLYLASLVASVFAIYFVLPKIVSDKVLIVFFCLLVVTAFVTAIYSDIAEFNTIINAFTAKGEDAHFYQIHSLFDNKNSYGMMLFLSLISLVYIYIKTHYKWLIVPFIYLFINLIISRSKTGLIILLLALTIYLIFLFIKTFKAHKVRNTAILIMVTIILTIGSLIVFVPIIASSNQFFANLSNYVKEAFIGQSFRSIQDRLSIFQSASALFSNPRIILGYGEHTCYSYATRLGYIDNAYIYNLLAGGIFKTLVFVYAYILIYQYVIKINKSPLAIEHKVLINILEVMILLYGLTENYQILGSNYTGFILLMFAYIMPKTVLDNIYGEEQQTH